MRGKRVNPKAVEWLLNHQNALTWNRLSIAKALKEAGIYSPKTYIKDIRVDKIIKEALSKIIVDEKK